MEAVLSQADFFLIGIQCEEGLYMLGVNKFTHLFITTPSDALCYSCNFAFDLPLTFFLFGYSFCGGQLAAFVEMRNYQFFFALCG